MKYHGKTDGILNIHASGTEIPDFSCHLPIPSLRTYLKIAPNTTAHNIVKP